MYSKAKQLYSRNPLFGTQNVKENSSQIEKVCLKTCTMAKINLTWRWVVTSILQHWISTPCFKPGWFSLISTASWLPNVVYGFADHFPSIPPYFVLRNIAVWNLPHLGWSNLQGFINFLVHFLFQNRNYDGILFGMVIVVLVIISFLC